MRRLTALVVFAASIPGASPCRAQAPEPLTFAVVPLAEGDRVVLTGVVERSSKVKLFGTNAVPPPTFPTPPWKGTRDVTLLTLRRGEPTKGAMIERAEERPTRTVEVEKRGTKAKGVEQRTRGKPSKLSVREAEALFGRLRRVVWLVSGLQATLPKQPVYPNKPLVPSDRLVRALLEIADPKLKLKRRMDVLKVVKRVTRSDKTAAVELAFDIKVSYALKKKARTTITARCKGTLVVAQKTGRILSLEVNAGRNTLVKKTKTLSELTEATWAEAARFTYPAPAASSPKKR